MKWYTSLIWLLMILGIGVLVVCGVYATKEDFSSWVVAILFGSAALLTLILVITVATAIAAATKER